MQKCHPPPMGHARMEPSNLETSNRRRQAEGCWDQPLLCSLLGCASSLFGPLRQTAQMLTATMIGQMCGRVWGQRPALPQMGKSQMCTRTTHCSVLYCTASCTVLHCAHRGRDLRSTDLGRLEGRGRARGREICGDNGIMEERDGRGQRDSTLEWKWKWKWKAFHAVTCTALPPSAANSHATPAPCPCPCPCSRPLSSPQSKAHHHHPPPSPLPPTHALTLAPSYLLLSSAHTTMSFFLRLRPRDLVAALLSRPPGQMFRLSLRLK
jgi:hypothetical protein